MDNYNFYLMKGHNNNLASERRNCAATLRNTPK